MKTSEREDQYRIIFLAAVWPERLYGIDFFEKSSEIRDSNLSEIDQFGPNRTSDRENWD